MKCHYCGNAGIYKFIGCVVVMLCEKCYEEILRLLSNDEKDIIVKNIEDIDD